MNDPTRSVTHETQSHKTIRRTIPIRSRIRIESWTQFTFWFQFRWMYSYLVQENPTLPVEGIYDELRWWRCLSIHVDLQKYMLINGSTIHDPRHNKQINWTSNIIRTGSSFWILTVQRSCLKDQVVIAGRNNKSIDVINFTWIRLVCLFLLFFPETANTLGAVFFNVVQVTCFKERRPCSIYQR